MKKPDTLVVITPAFPEDESASWWVPSQQAMVRALQQNYPSLTIKVLAIIYPYETEHYRWHDISVESFDGMHHRKLKRLVLWRRVWRSLRRIHRAHSIVGVLSFWSGECAFLAQHFSRAYALKHISWICGQDAKKENRWVRFFRPRGEQLAAMSASLRHQFTQSHGVRPQHVVPNAIDPALFPDAVAAAKDIDLMAAGSFEPLKQYDQYAGIVGTLSLLFPTLQAIHCGQGREKEKVEGVIKQLHIEKHLSLLGGMEHAAVLGYMQRSKVFLHTSRYEGCSTVCLEALYAGAHVISFCYPFDEPVPHWHVVKDAAEMAEKAALLLQDETTDYSPVLLHTMQESARQVMELFTNNETSCGS